MNRKKWIIAIASAGSGIVWQFSCSPVAGFFNLADSVLFCGTVLQCDPQVERLARADIDEAGSDPVKSPFTTIPGYDPADPLYGDVLLPAANP